MVKNKLQKESPLPLYYQLKEIIKRQIEEGHLQPGDAIPSERELVETYKISRPTVRQAINELVTEGLLFREKGRGTFVSKQKIKQFFLESLTSFSEEMKQKGLSFSTKVIGMEVVSNTSMLTSVFGDRYNKFFRIDRLRYVQGEPVVVVTTYVPCSIAPNLDEEDLINQSLYDILQNKYGLKISRATRVVEAINSSDEDAALLEIEPLSAIQLIRTTGYLEGDIPFEYSIARYRGDLSSFTVSLKYQKQG